MCCPPCSPPGTVGLRTKEEHNNALVRVPQLRHEAWTEEKLGSLLLMDINGIFDHVSANELLQKIDVMSADGNIV